MSGISDEDETPNPLEVEDVAPYLVFSREEQGGYSLCGGMVDALVAYAASPSNQGQNGQTFEHGCVHSFLIPACGSLAIDVWLCLAVLSSSLPPSPSPRSSDKLYTEAFILIYPTFITLDELVVKVCHR